MSKVVERFFEYVKFDTISDPKSETCPSSPNQKDLGRYLVEEMKAMGISNVDMDKDGYVYGEIPATTDKKVPTIGFIAHMDTSPDFTATNVKPLIHENFNGESVVLNEKENIVLSVKDFPELAHYKGQTLITTDGTTLLGADNKAGIAEILTMAEYFIANPEIPHGTIKIGFTPDEEIGRGADLFNVEGFAADYAYTVDGGEIGELEYENFNAASANITVTGRNIHPGSAKDKMINSLLIAMEFNNMLPSNQTPGNTEHYEGFNHLNDMTGNVESTSMLYIIRDHDREKFEAKKALMKDAEAYLNAKYGQGTVKVDVKDSYFNMKEKVEPVIEIVHQAKAAMEEVGVVPMIVPIRGGTDGARLSYMGLPCPNLFTGGHNFHGRFEYIVKESMEKAVEVVVAIVKNAAK